MTTQLVIVNQLGLHARAAVKLVKMASSYDCDVIIVRGSQRVSGKSIMGVMMLAAAKGTVLELIVEGVDEKEASADIKQLVDKRFGEDK